MTDLTTLANVAGWLRYSPNAADSALLSRLITAASDFVEAWCGRTFLSRQYDELRSGNGHRMLSLNNAPCTAVASVTIDGLAIPAAANPTSSGYRFTDTMVILNGWCFRPGVANVELIYTAGFATVPPSVEQAVIDLVALRYRELDRVGMASQSVGGETTAYVIRDMPPQVATALASWKPVVPRALV